MNNEDITQRDVREGGDDLEIIPPIRVHETGIVQVRGMVARKRTARRLDLAQNDVFRLVGLEYLRVGLLIVCQGGDAWLCATREDCEPDPSTFPNGLYLPQNVPVRIPDCTEEWWVTTLAASAQVSCVTTEKLTDG